MMMRLRAWGAVLAVVALMHAAPAALAADSLLLVNAEPAIDPWWLRARWQPRSQVVRGVPIKRLHPQWCAAEAFSRDLLALALPGPNTAAGAQGQTFFLEGSFDGSGRPQLAFVGAYRQCGGEQGLFLAIVEQHRDRPRMRFLVEVPDPGSALATLGLEPDGSLAVWWCVDCANGARIEFNRESRGFFVAGPASPRR